MNKLLKTIAPIILILFVSTCVVGTCWGEEIADQRSAMGRLEKLAKNSKEGRVYEGYFESATGTIFLIGGFACMLNPNNSFPINAVYGGLGVYSGVILFAHGLDLLNKPSEVEKAYSGLDHVSLSDKETTAKALLTKEAERARNQRLNDSLYLGGFGIISLLAGPSFASLGGLSICIAAYNYYYSKSSPENEYEEYLKGR